MPRLPRRFLVGALGGAGGFVTAMVVYRALVPAERGLESERSPDRLPESQTFALVGLIGAIEGAAFALVRPLLPTPPEVAGVAYMLASRRLARAAVRPLIRCIGGEQREIRISDYLVDASIGVWLGTLERRFTAPDSD